MSDGKNQTARAEALDRKSVSDGGSANGSGTGAAGCEKDRDEAEPLVAKQTMPWYSEFVTEKKFVYRQYVAVKLRGAYK